MSLKKKTVSAVFQNSLAKQMQTKLYLKSFYKNHLGDFLEILSSKHLTAPETALAFWAFSVFDRIVFLPFPQPSFPFLVSWGKWIWWSRHFSLSVYKMTSFFVMAAWCSIEWEYHNLFNGHYDCLEFFSATEVWRSLSIILCSPFTYCISE